MNVFNSVSLLGLDTKWVSEEDDHLVARGEYDFTAASQEALSMRAGEMLNLAPKELQPRVRGWLLASVDGETTGSSQPTTLRSSAREEAAGPQIWRGLLRPSRRTCRYPKQPWLHKYPNFISFHFNFIYIAPNHNKSRLKALHRVQRKTQQSYDPL
ncbi:hypothetical protein ACER0C_025820 [Sarotherodon galilaeus]